MIKTIIIPDKLEPKAPQRLRQKAGVFSSRSTSIAKEIRVRPLAQLPGRPRLGVLSLGNRNLICALGGAGIGAKRREGDNVTPRGRFAILTWLARFDRRGANRAHRIAITKKLGWCDTPTSPNYNRPVTLPFAGSCESMWRPDRLYDIVGVIDYNLRARAKGRGSAIFMHIAHDDYRATAGCIALKHGDLQKLAKLLEPKAYITIGDMRAPKIAEPTRT